MKKLKQIENELIEMINNHCDHDYKANAFKELDKVEEAGFVCPNCAFIVEQYPDFNSIMFRLEQPGMYVTINYININSLRNNDKKTKKAIHKLAKMVYGWHKQGGHEK